MAARIGVILVVGAILASIAAGIYAYEQYKTVPVYAQAGESVQIGPVIYVIEYEGVHDGDEVTRPENVFYKIGIRAKNTGDEPTRLSNSQFSIIAKKIPKTMPVFSNFTSTDLSGIQLLPGMETYVSTQFDVPYEADNTYVVQIRPTKEQSSVNIGLVCMSNCHDENV